MKNATFVLALLVLACCSSIHASAAVMSIFDNDADGWVVADVDPDTALWNVPTYAGLSWGPSYGQSGGGVRVGDITYWTHIAAPTRFLGDWSHGYGSTVAFDIFISYTDEVPYSAIALMGLNKTLYFITPPPVVGQWNHMVIPLTEANCNIDSYLGPEATTQDVMEVLASVEGFFIMSEWMTGPDDTYIDNVVLNLDPQRPKGMGIRGSSLTDSILTARTTRYRFTVWGQAQSLTADGFVLADGAGALVDVVAPGYSGVAPGSFVRATGVVEPSATPLTVRCDPRDVSTPGL